MVRVSGQVPVRGDIIQLDFNPRTGREQAGFRPAMVISPFAYNKISNIVLVCPITSREKGWAYEVKLPDELKTIGVVLTDQLKATDCRARNARFIEKASSEIVDEVLRKLGTLVS